MTQKIYKAGAFLIIENVDNDTVIELNSSNVQIKKEKTNVDLYNIINADGQSVMKVNLSEIVDVNGDPYSENDWNTFRFEQVGAQNTTDVSAVKPKVYKALLTQTGTAAPTAVVLENTLGDVVWTRASSGSYIGTLYGSFTLEKTFYNINSSTTSGDSVCTTIDYSSVDNIQITTTITTTGVALDSAMQYNSILIEVYP